MVLVVWFAIVSLDVVVSRVACLLIMLRWAMGRCCSVVVLGDSRCLWSRVDGMSIVVLGAVVGRIAASLWRVYGLVLYWWSLLGLAPVVSRSWGVIPVLWAAVP